MSSEQNARLILNRLRLRQLRIERTVAVLITSSLLMIIWLFGVSIESLFRLASPTRFTLLAVLITVSLLVIVLSYLRIKRDIRLRAGLSGEEYWALQMGRFAPELLRDRLLNALQVNRPRQGARDEQSEELAAESLYRIVAILPEVPLEQVNDTSRFRLAIPIAGSSLLVTLVVFALLGSAWTGALSRLVTPATDYALPPEFSILIEPAGGWAYRNEPVDFNLSVIGIAPKSVFFFYRQPGSEYQRETINLESGKGSIQFSGFPSTINYWIEKNDIRTEEYRLDIVTRPQITFMQNRIVPPHYTGLPAVLGRENIGDVEALPGSLLNLTIKANKPLSAAWVELRNPATDSMEVDSLPIAVKGNEGTFQMQIRREARYSIRLGDRDGHTDRDPLVHRIRLLSDEYPVVRIVFPDVDLILGEDMVIPLLIEADDDYGVSRLALEFRRLDDSLITANPLPINKSGDRSVSVETLWRLGNLALIPGDALEYWAVVYDNDNIRGPKRAESERRLVRLPTFEEIVSGVEQTEESAMEQAQKALDAAKQLREQVAKIADELKRNPNPDWQRRKQMEEAAQQQKSISSKIEEVQKTLDDLVQRLEKHDMLTSETLEKYQELQKLLSEVATPELKAAMDRLKQAIDAQDPEQIRQALEQFDMNREQFLRNIERSLNILQQLQLERKLDELVKRAEELLQAQELALRQIQSNDTKGIPEAQEMMARGMEMLQQAIQETSELAAKSDAQETVQQLDSLLMNTQKKGMTGRMRETGQSVAQGDIKRSEQTAEQSARDLAELQSALERTSRKLKDQRKAELASKLTRLVEELLIVSSYQEELMTESRTIGTQSPRYRDLAAFQGEIRLALAGVIGRAMDLSRETFFISPQLSASLGKALGFIDRSIEAYTDRNPRSTATPQKQAVGEINRSAGELLNILSQLQGAQSSTGFDEMMQKLSEMASAQQGLNQQSMPMPGPGGSETLPSADALGRMAAEQRALQQAMQQAAGEAQGMKEILGNLDGIAESMGEVARSFEENSLDERTRRLQRQIVSRLLDATRSAREQEYSKKRESRTGIDVSRRPPPEIKLDADRDKLRRDLLRALQEGYTPDYRRLIRDYYNSLEKEAGKE